MPMTSPPAALLIDALGTLVRLEPPAPRLRAELAARFDIAVSEQEAGVALLEEIRFYRAHLDAGRDATSLAALRERCAEVLRSALPASERLARVGTTELTDALLAALQFSAFDDARPAILAARNRGQRVVVASNWDVSLYDVLERIGLRPLLDGIVTSAEVGARKPAPAVFEQALAVAGADAADAVHVGDSVDEDVRGAIAAGIEPVLLSRDGREAPPGVRRITSLAELPGP
jgi:putative hydrolase of the HAD superfamily